MVVAVAGAAGLEATLAACALGRRVCIATKEVLVAAGELVVTQAAKAGGATLLPIDSEHSAIFQCVQGYPPESARKNLAHGVERRTVPHLGEIPDRFRLGGGSPEPPDLEDGR